MMLNTNKDQFTLLKIHGFPVPTWIDVTFMIINIVELVWLREPQVVWIGSNAITVEEEFTMLISIVKVILLQQFPIMLKGIVKFTMIFISWLVLINHGPVKICMFVECLMVVSLKDTALVVPPRLNHRNIHVRCTTPDTKKHFTIADTLTQNARTCIIVTRLLVGNTPPTSTVNLTFIRSNTHQSLQ